MSQINETKIKYKIADARGCLRGFQGDDFKTQRRRNCAVDNILINKRLVLYQTVSTSGDAYVEF